jgi:uridine kinase
MSDNQIYNEKTLRKYLNTLVVIYIEAVLKVFPGSEVFIEYAVNKGLYTEIKPEIELNIQSIKRIKDEMKNIIDSNFPIEKKIVSKKEASTIFGKQKMYDKIKLLNNIEKDEIEICRINGYFFKVFGEVFDSTGKINNFDLKIAKPGIILLYPRKEDNYDMPDYIHQEKLFNVFKESENWAKLLKINNVGDLNQSIIDRHINDIIRVSEALHEKKIANIADNICSSLARVILIAGPSSSGKTTFANRLGVQLKVNGKDYITISLDDYFVDRKHTPLDENGNYNFDTIDALDLELFNDQLKKLLKGEKVQIPTFNFLNGEREYTKPYISVEDNQYIVIEGIHGLNDRLTESIDKSDKYKIYISALTQLNIDNHNRISTTDLRLIRRMIRDNAYRGHNGTKTLHLWENVVKGENKYIFPYQENADVMFNSSLIYELAVLKKYAIPVINEIDSNGEFGSEKTRLLEFLNYFKEIKDDSVIPNTSIIKEFIGGSCFE